MDFRPDSKTLAINYTITFGIVAGILLLSVGKFQSYYYSPEYTSHQGYGTPVSCQSCHTSAWKHADQKTCSTANCHSSFAPDFLSPNLQAIQQTETGKPKPGYGAILSFHRKLEGMQCEACHPSHKLPQRGLLNDTTLYQMVHADPNARMTREDEAAQRAKAFHGEAGKIVSGITTCQTCHAAPNDMTHNSVGKQGCWECHVDFGKWISKNAAPAMAPATTRMSPLGQPLGAGMPNLNQVAP